MSNRIVTEEAVEDRLEDKMIALVEQVSTLRKEQGLSQGDLAERIDMDKGQFSRLLHSAENMTLETVVKLEIALGDSILVTPDDFAESLVFEQGQLAAIVTAAIKENPEFLATINQMAGLSWIDNMNGRANVSRVSSPSSSRPAPLQVRHSSPD